MSDTERSTSKATTRTTAKAASDAASGAAEAATAAATDLVDATGEAARSTVDSISQAASDVAQKAGDVAQKAGAAAQRASGVLTDVAGDVATQVSTRAPAVVDASRTTAGVAAREVREASSENLMLATVFSGGMAVGLFLARSSRILVLLSLVPAIVMAADLIRRRNDRGRPATTAKTAAKKATAG